MEDYAKIYHETEVKKLQQHSVMQGLTENDIRAQALLMENPNDGYATKIIARGAYESGARWAISKLSGSPTVGKAGGDASVSDGKWGADLCGYWQLAYWALPIVHNVFGVYLRFLANPQFAMKNGFWEKYLKFRLYISYIWYIFTS